MCTRLFQRKIRRKTGKLTNEIWQRHTPNERIQRAATALGNHRETYTWTKNTILCRKKNKNTQESASLSTRHLQSNATSSSPPAMPQERLKYNIFHLAKFYGCSSTYETPHITKSIRNINRYAQSAAPKWMKIIAAIFEVILGTGIYPDAFKVGIFTLLAKSNTSHG